MVISVKTESDEKLWRQFAYYSPESSYQLHEQFACICPKQCTFGSLQNMRVLPLLDRIGLNSTESRDSAVGIMTRLRHGCPRNYGSIPGRFKGFISSPKHPDRFCHPPCHLFSGHRFFFPEHGTDHSLPPCAEGKNAWSYTTTHPYAFMACTGTTWFPVHV
jgi:hypothetical protein